MYYEKPMQVSYYDSDVQNRLKLSAAMRYMQQSSSEQLELLDISAERLHGENMVFLLTKSCMKIHRMPLCTEKILVGTAAVATRGVRFIREFVINSEQGERLASALTLWILADTTSHKILRPASFPYALPFQHSITDGAITDIPLPKALPPGERMETDIRICYSHLDVNYHVNNSFYGDFVCDALPFGELLEKGLDTVVIHFQNEAREGENVHILTGKLGAGEYHIVGTHGGNPCFEAYAKLGK